MGFVKEFRLVPVAFGDGIGVVDTEMFAKARDEPSWGGPSAL